MNGINKTKRINITVMKWDASMFPQRRWRSKEVVEEVKELAELEEVEVEELRGLEELGLSAAPASQTQISGS